MPEARYRVLDAETLRATLSGLETLAAHLGGHPRSWVIQEIGDGNLNLIFRVDGSADGLIVKQALPYLRLVGQSWPLATSRSTYESMALRDFAALQPGMLPTVLHDDPVGAFIAMELLTPHIPLRNALLDARRLDHLADHLSGYLASTLARTSELFLSQDAKMARIARYRGNHAMVSVTDTLVFTEPFATSARNRWTRPELDPLVDEIKQDDEIRDGVESLRQHFLHAPEALLHGDLHTSSIMVTGTDTQIIDPEFVCYGPMGFDIGVLLGDLLLSYFAQGGHRANGVSAQHYGDWILDLVEAIWLGFKHRFAALWETSGHRHQTRSLGDTLAAVLRDTIGFAAVEMMRRILGLAHVIDFETIPDRARRSACERSALLLARWLLLSGTRCDDIREMTGMARQLNETARTARP